MEPLLGPPLSVPGVFTANGLWFGSCTHPVYLSSNATERGLFDGNFFSLAMPETSLFWNSIADSEDPDAEYDFSGMDSLVSLIPDTPLMGTHLLWHYALPSWYAALSLEEKCEQIDRFASLTVNRYRNQMIYLVAVNEAWDQNNRQFYDDAEIGAALAAVKSRGMRTVINSHVHTQFIEDQVARWAAKGLVDVYAYQAHMTVGTTELDEFQQEIVDRFPYFMDRLSRYGVSAGISEMDVGVAGYNTRDTYPAEMVAAQVTWYEKFLSMLISRANAKFFCTWGTRDNLSWRTTYNPVLLKRNYDWKDAIYAMVAILAPDGRWPTRSYLRDDYTGNFRPQFRDTSEALVRFPETFLPQDTWTADTRPEPSDPEND